MKNFDEYKIKKRDDSLVVFQPEKIKIAISKAMKAVGMDSTQKKAAIITEKVVKKLDKKYFSKSNIPGVEEIQDIVEHQLIQHKLSEAAKAYILYRDLHNRIRNINNLVDILTITEDYINKDDWQLKENSTIDYSLSGLYNHIQHKVGEVYWLNQIMPADIRRLHHNKDFHIHKLAAISAYCVGWDLMDLLRTGFRGVRAKMTCKPPKHFSSALGQLVNFLFTLSNETPEGAVAVSNLDTLLAPFIYYDKLDEDQTRQVLQEFIFNMNCPTKVGGQAPFSNVTLDLKCPKHLADQPVIVGGQPQDKTYGEFQDEMDLFNKLYAEIMMSGDATDRVFSWPIPTYNITPDFDWDNETLEPIWEMTSKYGIPYFANFVNSDMDPEDTRSMCCRLRIDNRELQKRGGGFFGANPLTGSIGYTTINLPRLGYLYEDEGELYKRLDYLLDKAAQSLYLKRKALENLTEKGLYPYSKFYLRSVKEKTGSYWSNHFNTIGIIGMNECCLNYMNKDLTTPAAQKFANKMMDHINDKLRQFQKESDQMFNLEASPAEGTTYRMARKDKELYPDIIVANEEEYKTDKQDPYYTNSTHLPVGCSDDIFEALDLQNDLQTKYTGGTVFHGFLGEKISDNQTTKNLVKKISANYAIPYFTLTPTFSICPTHGYINGEVFKCPDCDKECEVYSRVVGKIHAVQMWNPGKTSEFKQRQNYRINK
jgi:ribonucleoside-triphosphate reductase